MNQIKQNNQYPGCLTISLDFELYWGMRDHIELESYHNHLQGVYQAIPTILDLFKEYQIRATWAVVGFLYFQNIQQLKANLPQYLPSYKNSNLSPYTYINQLVDIKELQFHFSSELIDLIKQYPGQEIGTHTFSHYYCLEEGQTEVEFQADLASAIAIAQQNNLETNTIVFPRNQYNEAYLNILRESKLICYRGNEQHKMYRSVDGNGDCFYKRFFRLVNTYINLSGNHCYQPEEIKQNYPVNIPASRFLRPYSPKLKNLEPLRLNRIKSSLNYAAQEGLIYHLWWHPHNFGANISENMQFLRKILIAYSQLRDRYQMQSLNMGELAQSLLCV